MLKTICKNGLVSFLVLAMVLLLIPAAVPAGAEPEEADLDPDLLSFVSENSLVLPFNETVTVSGEDGEAWYSFTPEENGTYKFFSTNNGDLFEEDESLYYEPEYFPSVTLYNSSGKQLGYNELGGEDDNFRLIAELKTGKTYYLQFGDMGGSDSFTYDVTVCATEPAHVVFHANHETAFFEGAWNDETESYKKTETTKVLFEDGEEIYDFDYCPEQTNPEYLFVGWSLDPDASFPEDLVIARDGLELYAVWEEQVPVLFHANSSLAYFDSGLDDESPVYTEEETFYYREGEYIGDEDGDFLCYDGSQIVFTGWSLDPDAEEPDFELFAKAGLELYAVWKKAVPVTFHVNLESAYFLGFDEEDFLVSETELTAYYPEGAIIENDENSDFAGDFEEEYLFLGWSTDSSAEKPDPLIVADQPLELYGVWMPFDGSEDILPDVDDSGAEWEVHVTKDDPRSMEKNLSGNTLNISAAPSAGNSGEPQVKSPNTGMRRYEVR